MDEFLKAKERLKGLREGADATADVEAQAGLRRIDSECLVSEIESLVGPAASQTDAARQRSNVLLRLQSSLDDVEDALEWPALVAQAEKSLAATEKLVKTDQHATAEDRRLFELLERETREATEHRLPDLLRRRVDALRNLFADVTRRDPGVPLTDADSGRYRLLLAPGKRGSRTEYKIAGRIFAPPPSSIWGLTLEFTNVDAKPEWKSGVVSLSSTGAFSLDVGIDPAATTNEFHVTLRDSGGNRLRLTPDYFVLRTDAEM